MPFVRDRTFDSNMFDFGSQLIWLQRRFGTVIIVKRFVSLWRENGVEFERERSQGIVLYQLWAWFVSAAFSYCKLREVSLGLRYEIIDELATCESISEIEGSPFLLKMSMKLISAK